MASFTYSTLRLNPLAATRREGLLSSIGAADVVNLPTAQAVSSPSESSLGKPSKGTKTMPSSAIFKTKDGTELFYKDWGTGQPIVFHHGWPLSADDWDSQMLFFEAQGYRVIAYDRRGHGRSTQTDQGNDMDTYAADSDELVKHLDLKNAIHVGHSTGGGRGDPLCRPVRRRWPVFAKAAIISAIRP